MSPHAPHTPHTHTHTHARTRAHTHAYRPPRTEPSPPKHTHTHTHTHEKMETRTDALAPSPASPPAPHQPQTFQFKHSHKHYMGFPLNKKQVPLNKEYSSETMGKALSLLRQPRQGSGPRKPLAKKGFWGLEGGCPACSQAGRGRAPVHSVCRPRLSPEGPEGK